MNDLIWLSIIGAWKDYSKPEHLYYYLAGVLDNTDDDNREDIEDIQTLMNVVLYFFDDNPTTATQDYEDDVSLYQWQK